MSAKLRQEERMCKQCGGHSAPKTDKKGAPEKKAADKKTAKK